jgi:hypothetical protein
MTSTIGVPHGLGHLVARRAVDQAQLAEHLARAQVG